MKIDTVENLKLISNTHTQPLVGRENSILINMGRRFLNKLTSTFKRLIQFSLLKSSLANLIFRKIHNSVMNCSEPL